MLRESLRQEKVLGRRLAIPLRVVAAIAALSSSLSLRRCSRARPSHILPAGFPHKTSSSSGAAVPSASSTCQFCRGTGRCHRCGGTGELHTLHSRERVCTECKGTGKCAQCGGTGRLPGYALFTSNSPELIEGNPPWNLGLLGTGFSRATREPVGTSLHRLDGYRWSSSTDSRAAQTSVPERDPTQPVAVDLTPFKA